MCYARDEYIDTVKLTIDNFDSFETNCRLCRRCRNRMVKPVALQLSPNTGVEDPRDVRVEDRADQGCIFCRQNADLCFVV
jgi:hypothetical protein